MKNTYRINNKFKNYKFSEGEDLTEMDLEAIASRTKWTYETDSEYEAYFGEEYSSYIPQADLVAYELDGENGQFRIGNNLPNSL